MKNIYLVNVEKSDIQYIIPVPYQAERSEVFISVTCGRSSVQDNFVGGISTKDNMTDTHTILLTFHKDKSVTVSGWNEMEVEDLGNGLYLPDEKNISIHYSYRNPTDQIVYVQSETFVKNIVTN